MTETGDGVSPLKVQYNYESRYGSGDGVNAPKNWLHFGIHMVIKTQDDSTCKMYNEYHSYIYLTYMWKCFKQGIHRKNGIGQ